MINVVLAIVLSTGLAFLFKLFTKWGVDTFQAIVINYYACVVFCLIFAGGWPGLDTLANKPWLTISLILGFMFIIGFNILAYCVQRIGLIITTLFQKMSLLITVILTVLVFNEPIGWAKIIGITMAFVSIIMTYEKRPIVEYGRKTKWDLLILIMGVFAMSGIIDFIFFYSKAANLIGSDDYLFIGTCFATAGTLGLVVIAISYAKGLMKWNNKNAFAGLLLGVPNIFSVFYILQSIAIGIDGSVLFPILNMGILLLSTALGIAVFKEKLSIKKWLALSLATLSILIIGLFSS